MNINNIVDFIFTIDNNEDLSRIIDAVEGARQRQAIMARISFRVGDRVTFKGKGVTRVGTIDKICQKNIKVKVWNDARGIHQKWTVSPTLLTKES